MGTYDKEIKEQLQQLQHIDNLISLTEQEIKKESNTEKRFKLRNRLGHLYQAKYEAAATKAYLENFDNKNKGKATIF